LERQWLDFEAARHRETIIEWLRSIGVEPANPEASTYNPPPLPDFRKIMFATRRSCYGQNSPPHQGCPLMSTRTESD
jgi:hypothetical protein